MTAIIIIGIIFLIIYTVSNKKNTKVTVSNSSSSNNYNDDSIIDVTDQSYRINSKSNLKKYSSSVPYWAHHYVYSYSEINSASTEQKKFYTIFKNSFLNGEYYDLEGNTNYAFILLFDILNEFEKHTDIIKLENQLRLLRYYYPITKYYADNYYAINKPQLNYNYSNNSHQNTYQDFEYWKIGNKYKTILNLTSDDVNLLNSLWYQGNSFFDIEFFKIQIIKLFLFNIKCLDKKYMQDGSNIKDQFQVICGATIKNVYKYSVNSQNYKSSLEQLINSFYLYIFKYSENNVREFYNHKRKLIPYSLYTPNHQKEIFEANILPKLLDIKSQNSYAFAEIDELTEIELNSQNTNRWKIRFEEITSRFIDKPNDFIEAIVELGKLNKKNPSIENIFFEASKIIAKNEKGAALTLYVHYLYHDLKSATFDNKQLTRTIQKSLFKTNEQLHDFEILVSELIKDKDLDKALKSVSRVYDVKRKKIQLDTASIKEVQQQHSGTVELLNEYLKDDFEDENNTIESQEISNEEIKIVITQKSEEVQQSVFVSELAFSEIHTTALELFAKSNFSLPQSELETFAKSKGIFKNQLVESINDICYDFLDDVLIEEEDDYYTINTNYFQSISTK